MTAAAARPKPHPASDLFPLLEWAAANGIGEGAAYEFCRREDDPMPHVRQGTRILVEPDAALPWLTRTFGVGYDMTKAAE